MRDKPAHGGVGGVETKGGVRPSRPPSDGSLLTARATYVLIVDDDPDCREIVSVLLEAEGHVCETAADGAEALEALRRGPPAIVVLDVMMPRVHGIDVVKVMRADPQLSDVPIVVVSAAPTEAYASVAAERRVYLAPKPLNVDRFLTTVRALIAEESTA